jgi:hypothetical protein
LFRAVAERLRVFFIRPPFVTASRSSADQPDFVTPLDVGDDQQTMPYRSAEQKITLFLE